MMADSSRNGEVILEDVIIIGAGAAGIAALSRLLENGIEKVRILEAENRIGGRIHSVHLGDAFVDLGAEEVHGEKGNLVVELAGKHLKKKKPLTESLCYFSNGKEVDESVRKEVMELIEDFCEDDKGFGKSIGDAFTKRFNETIMKHLEENEDKKKTAISFLPLCESFFSILEGPYSWFDVILESSSNYEDCEGDQFLGWNSQGCKTILDILMEKNPKKYYEDRIILAKVVNKISWGGKHGVVINCQDGSRYRSKHVIFTPSVGVLRETHLEMFEPNLPKNKKEILPKIGYSNVMKVVLRFKKKWWGRAPIALIWTEDNVDENSWLSSVHWLMEAPENTKVLVAWLTGPQTPHVEELSDDEIKYGIMKVINMFLSKDFVIPEPEEVIATRWHSNPNFRGTYSYETPEIATLDVPFQKILEEPLVNEEGETVVLFAGEATHLTQYSTVNGAILSGYREADNIIGLRNKNV